MPRVGPKMHSTGGLHLRSRPTNHIIAIGFTHGNYSGQTMSLPMKLPVQTCEHDLSMLSVFTTAFSNFVILYSVHTSFRLGDMRQGHSGFIAVSIERIVGVAQSVQRDMLITYSSSSNDQR